jgi:sugar phosphate isomerase/epimerase
MLASQLAAQMYTIRDYTKTEADLAESLHKLTAIGYQAVQLSAVGAMDGDAPAVSATLARRMLDDNGLRCAATHRNWDDLADRTAQEIDFHHALSCDYTAIGGLPRRYAEQGTDGYRQFVRDAAPVIARLKAAGIRWGYHNHDHEFIRTGQGQHTRYDIFIEEGGADFTLEIDVYWAIHAGVSPERLLERCQGRVPVIHLKDKEVVPKDGPIMAAIGEGNLDWAHILPVCARAGVEVYAVEQDVCPRDPFDCLRSSFQFLTQSA